jgi:hypothetical protein
MPTLAVQSVSCLGAETIRVWRFYRLFTAIRRWWLRLTWRETTRAIFVLQLADRPSLQAQCAAATAMPCLACRTAIALPIIPADLLVSTTAFGCGVCHAYYYVSTDHRAAAEPRYDDLRAQLAHRSQR